MFIIKFIPKHMSMNLDREKNPTEILVMSQLFLLRNKTTVFSYTPPQKFHRSF